MVQVSILALKADNVEACFILSGIFVLLSRTPLYRIIRYLELICWSLGTITVTISNFSENVAHRNQSMKSFPCVLECVCLIECYFNWFSNVFFLNHSMYVKGSLQTTIFSKCIELLQLKNIFRIFWNYFWNIFEIKVYVKSGCFSKMADIDNNKLIGLLIIAGESLLLSQEHIKERREKKKMGASSYKKGR